MSMRLRSGISGEKMTVVFRVDASVEIGTGHVMRCLTIAQALRDFRVESRFVCRAHEGNLIELIRQWGFPVTVLSKHEGDRVNVQEQDQPTHARWLGCSWERDAEQVRDALSGNLAEWLVADHYALDSRWEMAVRSSCRQLVVIDDLADRRHASDVLIDHGLGRDAAAYRALVPERCQMLLGPQYTPLRPEFRVWRRYSLQRRREPKLTRLLISMGGVDRPNATSATLEWLKFCKLPTDCQITVVMGLRSPWLHDVRRIASNMPWRTTVRIGVANMAALMAESDLAIGAAGTTAWERCCVGLPSVVIALAENQKVVAGALHENGAAYSIGGLDTLREMLPDALQYLSDEKHLSAMITNASRLTDGYGAIRLANHLMAGN